MLIEVSNGSLDTPSASTEGLFWSDLESCGVDLLRQDGLSLDVPIHKMFAAAFLSLFTNLLVLFRLRPQVVQQSLEYDSLPNLVLYFDSLTARHGCLEFVDCNNGKPLA